MLYTYPFFNLISWRKSKRNKITDNTARMIPSRISNVPWPCFVSGSAICLFVVGPVNSANVVGISQVPCSPIGKNYQIVDLRKINCFPFSYLFT